MTPPIRNSLPGLLAPVSGVSQTVVPESLAVHLVGYLDTSLGSRQKSAELWGGLKTLAVHPVLRQIAITSAFAEIITKKREYVDFRHLAQVVMGRQSDFGLGLMQKIGLATTLLPWQGSQGVLSGLAAEYAKGSGYSEGMAALEIGMYLALHPESEELTRAVFKEVDRHLTS